MIFQRPRTRKLPHSIEVRRPSLHRLALSILQWHESRCMLMSNCQPVNDGSNQASRLLALYRCEKMHRHLCTSCSIGRGTKNQANTDLPVAVNRNKLSKSSRRRRI